MPQYSEQTRQRMLAFIATCADPKKLRQTAANAAVAGDREVQTAARRRLYEVLPAEEPGTLEYEVWRSIYALEDVLSEESSTTKRLSRTRQKIGRDGEHKTVCDLILGKPSAGFAMLVERDMFDLTFEAVALRFPDRFDPSVTTAARERLASVAGSG